MYLASSTEQSSCTLPYWNIGIFSEAHLVLIIAVRLRVFG
jgi:hypothetical protein